MSLTAVEQLADGRVHTAEHARALGLIDAVKSFDDTLAELAELAETTIKNPKRSSTMSQENPKTETVAAATETGPQAAGFEQLVAALPKADNDFLVEAIKKKLSVDQARDAWTQRLQEQLAAKDQELAAARAAGLQKKPGLTPVIGSLAKTEGEDENPVALFDQQVRQRMNSGLSRQQAVIAAARARPDLHRAFLEATNSKHSKVQSLIAERFDLVG